MDFIHQITAYRIAFAANTFLWNEISRSHRLLKRGGHDGRKDGVEFLSPHGIGSGLSDLYPVQGEQRTGAVKTGGPV